MKNNDLTEYPIEIEEYIDSKYIGNLFVEGNKIDYDNILHATVAVHPGLGIIEMQSVQDKIYKRDGVDLLTVKYEILVLEADEKIYIEHEEQFRQFLRNLKYFQYLVYVKEYKIKMLINLYMVLGKRLSEYLIDEQEKRDILNANAEYHKENQAV